MRFRNKLIVLIFFLILLPFLGIAIFDYWHENTYSGVIYQVKRQKLNNPTFDVFMGEVEPDFPNEELNLKGLKGIDSNKNKIRDDIDIWINRTTADKELNLAIKEYARRLHDVLVKCNQANSFEKSKLLELEEKLKKINWQYVNQPSYYSEKIKILTLNTAERKKCYL